MKLSEKIKYLKEIYGKTNEKFFIKSIESAYQEAIELEGGKKYKGKLMSKQEVIITDRNYRPMYFCESDNRLYYCTPIESRGKGRPTRNKSVKPYTIQMAHQYILKSMEQTIEERPLTDPKEIDYTFLPFER